MLARIHLGKDYKVHEHITLPTPDGTTQIDVLIISRYGIFVIEVKDYQRFDLRRRETTPMDLLSF